MKNFFYISAFLLLAACSQKQESHNAVVFMSDFGLEDGAVSAMKGVAFSVSHKIRIFDVTHEISPFNIYEAAHRLHQVARYWPSGTVFVSIIDPGVGSERKSIVMKTKSGHYFVSPDNGTLTLIANALGVESVREIDETKNRLPGSEASYTFHGRDVYAYTGARLAAEAITFEEVGPELHQPVVMLSIPQAQIRDDVAYGTIPVLDVRYGNVWTNIEDSMLQKLQIKSGDYVHVKIFRDSVSHFQGDVQYVNTFADVKVGEPLGYINSLMNFSLGINQGDFAAQYKIGTGDRWKVSLSKRP
jgi:S-adenosylmethionine hydrolase